MALRAGEWIVVGGAAVIISFAIVSGIIIYIKPPPVEYVYLEDEKSMVGELLYRSQGCGACHEIFGNGPSFGPKLDGVGSKRNKEWLRAYLLNPRPGVSEKKYRLKMQPVTGLTDAELDSLVDYLAALKKAPSADSKVATSKQHG